MEKGVRMGRILDARKTKTGLAILIQKVLMSRLEFITQRSSVSSFIALRIYVPCNKDQVRPAPQNLLKPPPSQIPSPITPPSTPPQTHTHTHTHLPLPPPLPPHSIPNRTNPPTATTLNPTGNAFPLRTARGTLLPASTALASTASSTP
jgi:hypothetical protein